MNFRLVKNIDLNSNVWKNKSIDTTDLDGEKVMMNMDEGQYFMMNSVASRIWDIVEENITCNKIVETLLNEYDVEKSVCEETVIKFVRQMNDANLVNVK